LFGFEKICSRGIRLRIWWDFLTFILELLQNAMFREKFIGIAIWLYAMANGLPPDNAALQGAGRQWKWDTPMSTVVVEMSGLAYFVGDSLWLAHADSGSPPALYLLNPLGHLLDTLNLPALRNIDWEDMARDAEGNYYIGDVGNNLNKRRNLVIYKLSPALELIGEIQYSYQDQPDFPPHKKNRNFDCEAFFWAEGSLHLFSKNRGDKCVRHYRLPDTPGQYDISPVNAYYLRAPITAADIHLPTGKVALLGYGRVYLLSYDREMGEVRLTNGGKIPAKRTGQAEAILWLDDTTLLLGNEKGKLWKLRYQPSINPRK
jgi:hypothetical protein